MLPHFVEAHQTKVVDVKEKVVRATAKETRLFAVAAHSSDYAGGEYMLR